MDFLRHQFEEQLELEVTSTSEVKIGETTFTPVDILKADLVAYENEFIAWKDGIWLPRQDEVLDEILNVHANRKRFVEVTSALLNGQLVPLIGSGMSVPTGLPQWSAFLRSICKHSSLPVRDLEAMLAGGQFEEAVDALAAAMPGRLFDERIEHDLRIDDPAAIIGAVQFMPELFDTLCLTTNLDDLLERLYERVERPFSHALNGQSIADYRQIKGGSKRTLLKLHGDCRQRRGRVLGRAEYDAAYTTGSPVRDELELIYRNNSVLCIGCSLGADRTVNLLADIAHGDPNMPKHYAFLNLPTDPGIVRDREHFLTERDVFPIWYPGGHDESIQALMVGMLKSLGKF